MTDPERTIWDWKRPDGDISTDTEAVVGIIQVAAVGIVQALLIIASAISGKPK